MLLRVGRRRTAWEAPSIDSLLKVEFRTGEGEGDIDLRPSVYKVTEQQVVQTVAEHAAGNGLDPPRGFDNVDLSCEREIATTPGETGFAFTTSTHRELQFRDVTELREFILNTILPTFLERRRVATKGEIKQYVKQRLAAQDPEWLRVVDRNDKWP